MAACYGIAVGSVYHQRFLGVSNILSWLEVIAYGNLGSFGISSLAR